MNHQKKIFVEAYGKEMTAKEIKKAKIRIVEVTQSGIFVLGEGMSKPYFMSY